MAFLLAICLCQIGIDAGPAGTSCEGSVVTLAAKPINPPANYLVEWEDGFEPGIFLIVDPLVTTTYRVYLTNLDTNEVFEDETRVLVAPITADLFPDGNQDNLDWLTFFSQWGGPVNQPEFDPDGDGKVSILDWFYICNFQANPLNTPPFLLIQDTTTYQGESANIDYFLDDAEGPASLNIDVPPANGTAFILSGDLIYDPNPGFIGTDFLEVYATDGTFRTLNQVVEIDVLAPETWDDLYASIFFVRCKACHIDAVSGGLSLATYGSAQAGGVNGAAFLAGFPQLSPLYLRVADGSMPLGMTPLSNQDVQRIRIWIERGASP